MNWRTANRRARRPKWPKPTIWTINAGGKLWVCKVRFAVTAGR